MIFKLLLKKGPIIGLVDLAKRMKDVPARATYVAASLILKEAQKRCPIDTGTLVASGYVYPQSPSREKRIGFNTEYALYVHERTYNLGPRSEQKESHVGVEVGPRFLVRAFYDMQEEQRDVINRVIRNLTA